MCSLSKWQTTHSFGVNFILSSRWSPSASSFSRGGSKSVRGFSSVNRNGLASARLSRIDRCRCEKRGVESNEPHSPALAAVLVDSLVPHRRVVAVHLCLFVCCSFCNPGNKERRSGGGTAKETRWSACEFNSVQMASETKLTICLCAPRDKAEHGIVRNTNFFFARAQGHQPLAGHARSMDNLLEPVTLNKCTKTRSPPANNERTKEER